MRILDNTLSSVLVALAVVIMLTVLLTGFTGSGVGTAGDGPQSAHQASATEFVGIESAMMASGNVFYESISPAEGTELTPGESYGFDIEAGYTMSDVSEGEIRLIFEAISVEAEDTATVTEDDGTESLDATLTVPDDWDTDDDVKVTLQLVDDDGFTLDTRTKEYDVTGPETPPAVSTDQAAITTTGATLWGTLDETGSADSVDAYFEYRETGASSWKQTSSQSLSDTTSFSEHVSLEADTEYEYRAVATSPDGSDTGSSSQFRTDPEGNVYFESITPDADTELRPGETYDFDITAGYTLTSESGGEIRLYFESISADAEDTATVSDDEGTAPLSASLTVPDDWDTGNDLQVTIQFVSGEGDGLDVQTKDYDVSDAEDPPSVTTNSATNVGTDGATLHGSIDEMGTASSVDVYFEYRETGVSTWEKTSAQSVSSTTDFSESVSLDPGTEYEFRAIGSSPDGTDTGNTVTFSTDLDADIWLLGSASDPPTDENLELGETYTFDIEVEYEYSAGAEGTIKLYFEAPNEYVATEAIEGTGSTESTTLTATETVPDDMGGDDFYMSVSIFDADDAFVVGADDTYYVDPGDNTPPTIDEVEPEDDSLQIIQGESVEFAVESSDADGDSLTHTWYLNDHEDDDEFFEEIDSQEGSSATLEWTFEEQSLYSMKVEVSDGEATDDHTWLVEATVENQDRPPEITPLEPDAGEITVDAGETVDFEVEVTDPDYDLETVEWFVDGSHEHTRHLGGGSPQQADWGYSGFEDGEYTVTAEVTDSLGNTDSTTWTVVVETDTDPEPDEPALYLDSIDAPAAIEPGDDLPVTYTLGNDGEATGTESTVRLTVDGTTVDADHDVTVSPGDAVSSTLTFDATQDYDDGDVIDVAVELADSGASASESVTVEAAPDQPTDLDFDVTPDRPVIGERVEFSATGYDPGEELEWDFGDTELAMGSPTVSHRYGSAGSYDVTLGEGDASVTRTVHVEAATDDDIVLHDVSVSGLHPLLAEAEDERHVAVTVQTEPAVEIADVSVAIADRSTSLEAVDESGTSRTWEGTVDVSHVSSETQAVISFEHPDGHAKTESRLVDVIDTPSWVETLFEYESLFATEETVREGNYVLDVELLDLDETIQSDISPWDEDLTVALAVAGELEIADSSVQIDPTVEGELGMAGVTGGAGVDADLKTTHDLEVRQLDVITSVWLEQEVLDETLSVEALYDKLVEWGLPERLRGYLPPADVCELHASGSIRGDVAHQMTFEDGIHPTEDVTDMALQGGPTLSVGGGGQCGDGVLSVDLGANPAVEGAIAFEPELPPEVNAAGIAGDVVLDADVSFSIFGLTYTYSRDWAPSVLDLAFTTPEGSNPFIHSTGGVLAGTMPSFSDSAGDWRLQVEDAHAPAPSMNGIAGIGESGGSTEVGKSGGVGDDRTVRITERPYDDVDPSLAAGPAGDDHVLVWSVSPETTGEPEPSNLNARIGSGSDWSEPIQITDNSHHEVMPDVATNDGRALAAWVQAQDADRDLDDLENPFREYEIAVSTADDPADESAWHDPLVITDGGAYESSPTVAPIGTDAWVLVWERNMQATPGAIDGAAVGYAVVSTAAGDVELEMRGSIEDARSPDVDIADDGDVHLVFHRPENGLDGAVVQGSLDPASGDFEVIAEHDVKGFTDVATAGEIVVWADGPGDAPRLTSADGTGATTALPVDDRTRQISDLVLTATGDRTALLYRAQNPDVHEFTRDVFTQVKRDGRWTNQRQLIRSTTGEQSLALSPVDARSTAVGTVVAYSAGEATAETSQDVFVTEGVHSPTYALEADIDQPAEPSVGTQVPIELSVANVGVEDATEPVTVQVTDGDAVLATQSLGPIEAGQEGVGELVVEVPASGEIVVAVEGADPATAGDQLVVQAVRERLLTAGLTTRSVTMAPVDESSSEAVVTVENTGDADAGSFTVALEDAGQVLGTATVDGVPGGEARTAIVEFAHADLDPATTESIVLDAEGELAAADVEQARTSAWVGRPNLAVEETVEYARADDGTIFALVSVANRGVFGANVTVSAVDPGSKTLVGNSTVDLPPAIEGSQYRQVVIPLDGLDAGEKVMVRADPDRPDEDVTTNAVWDVIGPVEDGGREHLEGQQDFAIEIVDLNRPGAGEDLVVTVEIENLGALEATQSIELDVGELGATTRAVTLPGGEAVQETFTVGTDEGDAGEQQVTVFSESDSATSGFEVESPTEGPDSDSGDVSEDDSTADATGDADEDGEADPGGIGDGVGLSLVAVLLAAVVLIGAIYGIVRRFSNQSQDSE